MERFLAVHSKRIIQFSVSLTPNDGSSTKLITHQSSFSIIFLSSFQLFYVTKYTLYMFYLFLVLL